MENDEKIYFSPGMRVQLKQDIPNKPVMIVEKKSELVFKDANVKTLKGIVCFWFTKDGYIQKNCFCTKDLVALD